MALPVPLTPEGAAWHAIVIQGGYSTPAIEAFRILTDALRIVRRGDQLDDRWTDGVRATLGWLDLRADSPEVQAERADFEARQTRGEDWRAVLDAAIG